MSLELSDPIELAGQLGPAERWLIALDFDGVLAPIVDHPDAARPEPETLEAVRTLAGHTAVAIVSGRPVGDLRERLGELPVLWAGGHGAELVRPDGTNDLLVDLAEVTPTLDALEQSLIPIVDDEPGWLIERKAASLAVHHRLADPDSVEELLPRVVAQLDARRDDGPGFDVLHGKAVLELRPSGTDKGQALARLAAQHPDLAPLVVGDDTTDEDAFRAARDLGGTAILVAEVDRASAAEHRIADPAAVALLLAKLADSGR